MGKKSVLSAFTMVLLLCTTGLGQANGKLQLHFMDVGQGDGAVLILRPVSRSVMILADSTCSTAIGRAAISKEASRFILVHSVSSLGAWMNRKSDSGDGQIKTRSSSEANASLDVAG